jgi:hypothetical protein
MVSVLLSCAPRREKVPVHITDSLTTSTRTIHMASFSITAPLDWGYYYGRNQVGSRLAEQRIELETDKCSILIRSYEDPNPDALKKWTDGFAKAASVKRDLEVAGCLAVELDDRGRNERILIVQGPKRIVVVLLRPTPVGKEEDQINKALNTLKFYKNPKE